MHPRQFATVPTAFTVGYRQPPPLPAEYTHPCKLRMGTYIPMTTWGREVLKGEPVRLSTKLTLQLPFK